MGQESAFDLIDSDRRSHAYLVRKPFHSFLDAL